MDIDAITQYILAIVPAVTAITGMAVMVGVGIGKIRQSNQITTDTVSEISSKQKALQAELVSAYKENAELKKELKKVLKKIEHIHFVDKEE